MSFSRTVRLCLVTGLVAMRGVAEVVVSDGPVVLGEWNTNFPAVVERARKEHCPMILVHVSQGCPLCTRLNLAIEGEAFRLWQKDRKLLMAYVRTIGKDGQYQQVHDFFQSINDKLPGYPYVCTYWPKEDGTTNCTAYSARRGELGVPRHELFSVEVMTALDLSLKDYLAKDPTHKTIEHFLANSTKKISYDMEGVKGKIVMRPADGLLPEGGKVSLEARPEGESVFVRWLDPNGKIAGLRPRLEVTGGMPAGTYKAKFRAKSECRPPSLPIAVTSMCVRVGYRFDYTIPVDDETWPVTFRAMQRLPSWLKLDKISGRLLGTPRSRGTVSLSIAVIGSDPARTSKVFKLILTVLPKHVKNEEKSSSGDGS